MNGVIGVVVKIRLTFPNINSPKSLVLLDLRRFFSWQSGLASNLIRVFNRPNGLVDPWFFGWKLEMVS